LWLKRLNVVQPLSASFFRWNWKIERKRVEIRQRRWTLVCCLLELYCICLLIYISNKTWESVEESVWWDGRRERKNNNNCEGKKKKNHDSYHCCWWFGLKYMPSAQVVLFARNTSPKSFFFFPCKNKYFLILFFYFPI
jgi:hypothetical protein